eukprot:scaffold17197_cov101-Isochrysis_galbana.AAC.3
MEQCHNTIVRAAGRPAPRARLTRPTCTEAAAQTDAAQDVARARVLQDGGLVQVDQPAVVGRRAARRVGCEDIGILCVKRALVAARVQHREPGAVLLNVDHLALLKRLGRTLGGAEPHRVADPHLGRHASEDLATPFYLVSTTAGEHLWPFRRAGTPNGRPSFPIQQSSQVRRSRSI